MADQTTSDESTNSFYSPEQRQLQDDYERRAMADRMVEAIVAPTIAEMHQAFIESRDFFYLATVNASGEPTVSYKGGPVGVVKVVDEQTLAFPFYDGNGMFLSAGNVSATSQVGLLFMDFETPHRVRVQGTASLHADDPLLEAFPGALTICRVAVTAAFVNCARYVHKHARVESSPYVPGENGEQPLPSWKRIDGLQDVLPDDDRARVADEGGTIAEHEYAEKLITGTS